ncbi:methyltransferase domain-containing protein [Streptomyces sp. SID8366]|uniref:class I SAM-dependent methyltransferase n=1 Tax=unclassified Streptomyces TaxID=2593676 RepID=UPI000DC3DC6D|nr:class I SAM-dependent methyltransferase [Streptomyces sp. PsTaAH-130]MYU06103.1 methyltransferase domain-containing protein [Streptomyces sp. SID8366]MYU61676.1 methyltransferase domain-containing protein [Streptomyces sp. SID69]RAJ64171.1 methyltransferase family protein [Streptomyces sp. PsTaAH-130]
MVRGGPAGRYGAGGPVGPPARKGRPGTGRGGTGRQAKCSRNPLSACRGRAAQEGITTITTTSQTERYGDELFSASHGDESERLKCLADTFDPVSRANLLALGLAPGWRALDVGAGTGSLGSWLASAAGPSGQVTVVDRDTRFLRHLASEGVQVAEADVTDPAFHPGLFDLVHARFVLMHLRDREEVLRRLASWLRPGGLLVVSDSLAVGGQTSPHEAYRRTTTAFWEMLAETIGSDGNCVTQYPRMLTGLGLRDIGTHVQLPVVGLHVPYGRFLELTLEQSKGRLAGAGLPGPVYDEALAHLRDARARETFFAMATCWGRAPAHP